MLVGCCCSTLKVLGMQSSLGSFISRRGSCRLCRFLSWLQEDRHLLTGLKTINFPWCLCLLSCGLPHCPYKQRDSSMFSSLNLILPCFSPTLNCLLLREMQCKAMPGNRKEVGSNPGCARCLAQHLKHVICISAAQFPEVTGSVLCRKHL